METALRHRISLRYYLPMRRAHLIVLAFALIGISAPPADAIGNPNVVRRALYVPTIDDEPRIAGYPMAQSGLIGVGPGQHDLLIASSEPAVSESEPSDRDFFRCSGSGAAQVGIPDSCERREYYQQAYIYGNLMPIAYLRQAEIGIWYRYGIEIDGTWRLSAAIGPVTAPGSGAPKNVIEPFVSDRNPLDGRDMFYVGTYLNFYRGLTAYGGSVATSVYICSAPALAQIGDAGVRGCARYGRDSDVVAEIPQSWSGKYVRLRRVAGNRYGTEIVWSATTPQIQAHLTGILPELLLPPEIFDDPAVGAELFASRGAWKEYDNSDPLYPPITEFTYAWYRCSEVILTAETLSQNCQEATSTTQFYTPTYADVGWRLMFGVTAFNGNGSRTRYTATSSVVPSPPLEPPVSIREPYLLLTTTILVSESKTYSFYVDEGEWTGFPIPAVSMVGLYRCSGGWGGQTSTPTNCTLASTASDYTTQGIDGGYRFRAKFIATNSEGTTTLFTATSDPVPILIPSNIGGPAAPIVTGWARPGTTITAAQGAWNGIDLAYKYQWLLCTTGGLTTPTTKPKECSVINRATLPALNLSTSQKGKFLRVSVTGANAFGTATRVSTAVGPISDPPASTSAPTITGSVSVGATITASPGAWTNAPTFSYNWYRCSGGNSTTPTDTPTGCMLINGAGSATYQPAAGDAGSYLRVRVAALNAGGVMVRFSRTTAVVP